MRNYLKVKCEDFELSAEGILDYKAFKGMLQPCVIENNLRILGNTVDCGQIPNTDIVNLLCSRNPVSIQSHLQFPKLLCCLKKA